MRVPGLTQAVRRIGLQPALIAACLAMAAAYLWRACHRNPHIIFLPDREPAAWILYPNPPQLKTHPVVETPAVFRRTFDLERAPEKSSLQVRAFRDFDLSLNGQPLPVGPAANWKQPVRFVPANLRAGQNQLIVTVRASNGPPALWLALETGQETLVTDGQWEVSWAGAVWQRAWLADSHLSYSPGELAGANVPPWQALRQNWIRVGSFALAVALVVAAWSFGRRRRDASIVSHQQLNGRSASAARWFSNPEPWLFATIVLAWIALFVNNTPILLPVRGFDAAEHLKYIQYLLEHRRLPSPAEGWSMYQPPLYYLVCAAALGPVQQSALDGVPVLRMIGLAVAIGQVALVRAGLRLLFPRETGKQMVGLALAAFLPAQLYIAQYVTNELLAAALVTATFYLCLRLWRSPGCSAGACAGIGACLAAALLTKATALLAVPFAAGFVAASAWTKSGRNSRTTAKCVALMLATCAILAGWYYLRLWREFGTPLVANWNAISGFDWWQDPGYRTDAYYSCFGHVFSAPVFAGFVSFADGVYSTLWGDGLLGGTGEALFAPPWDYASMSAGYILAAIPTTLAALGAVRVLCSRAKPAGPERFWLVAFVALAGFALVHVTLRVPSHSTVKAFFLLSAVLPCCALAGIGWGWMANHSRIAGILAAIALGTWALNSFASFWIAAHSSNARVEIGRGLLNRGDNTAGRESLEHAIQRSPANVLPHILIAESLVKEGRFQEASAKAEAMVRAFPRNATVCQAAGRTLAAAGQFPAALGLCRRAVELGPNDAMNHLLLCDLLAGATQAQETAAACREGLRVSPLNARLHVLLGTALLSLSNQPADAATPAAEARMHLRLAGALAAEQQQILRLAAWLLATHPDSHVRDGSAALVFAERAVSLGKDAQSLALLAAACAETGQMDKATRFAEQAKALADAAGQTMFSEQLSRILASFREGKPYRDAPAEMPER